MRDFMAFGGEKHPGGRTQVFVQDHASAKVTDVNGTQFSGPPTEPEVSEGSDHSGIVIDGISAKGQQGSLSFRSSAEQTVESQADLQHLRPSADRFGVRGQRSRKVPRYFFLLEDHVSDQFKSWNPGQQVVGDLGMLRVALFMFWSERFAGIDGLQQVGGETQASEFGEHRCDFVLPRIGEAKFSCNVAHVLADASAFVESDGIGQVERLAQNPDRACESFLKQFFFATYEVILGNTGSECERQVFCGDRLVEETEDSAFIDGAHGGFHVGISGEHDAD